MYNQGFNKLKVSESEINKKRDIGDLDKNLDVNFLKKYLSGHTYDDLCREHNISRAQVEIRLSEIMAALPERMRITIPDRKIIVDCLIYKRFWLDMIRNYQLGQQLYNNNILFSNFLAYFKRQDSRRQEYIIKQLQEQLISA